MGISGDIIIFGPTGKVGSAIAQSLAEGNYNGKLYLAMRDPQKTIPGLDEKASSTKFERIQADLSKPEELKEIVAKTGATKAFFYALFTVKDHMRAAVKALYDGGIRFVVFNSSAVVAGDRSKLSPQKEFVAWVHGMIEQTIIDILGPENLVALRPGWFDSNAHRLYLKPILNGEDLRIPFPDARLEWVAPEDIGATAAHFLIEGTQATAEGPLAEGDNIYIVGPQLLSWSDGVLALAKAYGRTPAVIPVLEQEEATKVLVSYGMPESLAGDLVKQFARGPTSASDESTGLFTQEAFDTCLARLQKYLGKPGMTLSQWIEKHRVATPASS